jgi:hypothetical protein
LWWGFFCGVFFNALGFFSFQKLVWLLTLVLAFACGFLLVHWRQSEATLGAFSTSEGFVGLLVFVGFCWFLLVFFLFFLLPSPLTPGAQGGPCAGSTACKR